MYQAIRMKLKQNKNLTSALTAVNLVLIYCVLISNANAIVFRHDIPAENFIAKESDFPAIFAVYDDGKIKDCVATLVAPTWALTAAHCTAYLDKEQLANKPHLVKISGSNNEVVNLFYPEQFGGYKMVRDDEGKVIDITVPKGLNYQYDIALLKLSNPVKNVTPITIYAGKEEKGKDVLFLGWGDYSTGDVGVDNDNPKNDRKFRMAWNQVDSISETQLLFDFDDPTAANSDALPLEGVSGPGDSGGPALLKTDTGYQVQGISSAGAYSETLTPQPKNTGKYGWLEYYTRVSNVSKWLNDIMNRH